MRFRLLFALALAAACSWAFGCNSITGIGSLTFVDSPSDGGVDGAVGGSSGSSSGGVAPSGTHAVTSATLQLRGMTTDGFIAYGDTSSGALSVLGVEQPDGGPPVSSSPVALGPADISTAFVDGPVVAFFSPNGEEDAGASRVGSLNVWTSTLGAVTPIASDVLESVTYFTFATSADGKYLAYLGNVAPDGATASLYLADLTTSAKTEVVTSIDVLTDLCQPRLVFSADYLVASYCQVASGGAIPSGSNRFIATVSSFAAPAGQQATLATSVEVQFGVDPNGVAAIMVGANGLIASPIAGAGTAGPVTIDSAGVSGVISKDGASVVYATSSDALKRGSTTAPVNATQLAASSFAQVNDVSSDGRWVIGALHSGSQDGTSDLYLASAISAGTAVTLSSATSAATDLAGDSFTVDSKYAVFLTGVTSAFTGALMTYPLATGGTPSSLGSGAFEDVAIAGSQLVYNLNDANGKADLQWVDLARGATPTIIASQADELFFVGPANDKVVYTYSGSGGGSDGLWISPIPGSPGTVVTCVSSSPISFHPPAGGSGSCTADDVSFFDTDCISPTTSSTDLCSGVSSVISASCYACLDTQLTSSSWGVVIENPAGGGIVQINAGGCYSKQGDSACANAVEAQLECENNACASQTTLDTFSTCQASADTAACACYTSNVTAACAPFALSTCNPATYTTFEAKFLAYAKVMCE